MLRYFLYGLSYLSTLLIVVAMPQSISKDFLQIFSTSSAVFGILVVILFTSNSSLSRTRSYLPILLLMFSIFTLIGNQKASWVIYPFALLISDYSTSQSGSTSLPMNYRVIMIISSVPFFLYPDLFNSFIKLRILICLLFSGLAFYTTKSFVMLKIKKIYSTLIISNFGYFGTLFCLTLVVNDAYLKMWYVGTQIALSLLLRRFDYLIRNNVVNDNSMDAATYFVVILISLILMAYYFNYLALFVFLLGVFFLRNLKKCISE